MSASRAICRIALTVALLVAFTRSAVAGPVFLRMRTPSTITTSEGNSAEVPPGIFLDQDSWDRLDAEIRRLQDAETDLTAQRDYLLSRPPTQWKTSVALVTGLVLGIVGTWYVTR